MLYFLSLGLGFIWIEVVFLKSFVLFLGSPVYSIAVVLFAMLIFAGLGSFYSERLRGTVAQKTVKLGIGLVVIGLAAAFIYPLLQQFFLGLPLLGRMLVAGRDARARRVRDGHAVPDRTAADGEVESGIDTVGMGDERLATVVGISSASLITTVDRLQSHDRAVAHRLPAGFRGPAGRCAPCFSASGAEPAFAAQAPGVA
jgi:hypothetical protein